jgi:hypothetical protein
MNIDYRALVGKKLNTLDPQEIDLLVKMLLDGREDEAKKFVTRRFDLSPPEVDGFIKTATEIAREHYMDGYTDQEIENHLDLLARIKKAKQERPEFRTMSDDACSVILAGVYIERLSLVIDKIFECPND